MIGRNHRHLLEHRIVEGLGQRILHQRFLQLKVGAGHGEILVASRNLGLGAHHVHGGHGLQLQLLLRVLEGLLGERQRLLVHPRLLIGADQIPVYVLDLSDGLDDLVLEGNVGDLLVVPGDTQIAQVGPEAESGKQLLLEGDANLRIQNRR